MVDKVEVQFGGQLTGLTAAINQATEQLEGMTAPISGLTAAFGALAEAGMAAFAVDRLAEWADEMARSGQEILDTSRELGMSTEQVSRLNVAFQAMGMDSQAASEGLARLSRAQEMAEMGSRQQMAAFQVLGLSMQQIKTMSPEDMLNRLADVFSRTADGTNKTALAMTLLGRAGAQMIPWLDKGREGLQLFEQIAQQTGTVWTESMAEGAEDTSIKMSVLRDSVEGVSMTLFNAFRPAIDQVVTSLTSMNEATNNSISADGGLSNALHDLVVTAQLLIKTFTDLIDILGIVVRSVMLVGHYAEQALGPIIGFAEGFQNAEIDGKGLFEALREGAIGWQMFFTRATGKVSEDLQNIKADLTDIWAVPTDKPILPGSGPTQGAPQVESMGDFYKSGQGQKQYLQDWQADLDKMLIDQNLFFDRAKQAEQAFWAQKLAYAQENEAAITASYVQAGSTQSQAVDKYDQLILQLRQKMYSFDQAALSQWLTSYKTGLDEQQAALKNSLAAGLITQQQFHDQSIALWKDWARVVAQTYGTTSTQYQAALKQEETYEKQHTAQSEINWKAMGNVVTNDFDQMLTGMLRGTQTFQQAFARLAENLVISMIEARAKIVVDWAIGQLEKLTVTNTTNTAIVASDTAQAGASAAAQNSADVLPSIMKHAGSAAAAVYDDVAQIPYVGWILAPAAAAAAFAAVAAFGSFDVGAYSLPSDMIIQAHQGEMILPAAQASMVRAGQASVGAFPGGMVAGGESGAGSIVNVTFAISAIDGQSVANVLKNQKSTIASVVADAITGGNSALKTALAKA
jgi:hypothetical protein